MANISSGILGDSNLINLKEMPVSKIRPEVRDLLVEGEDVVQSFQTVRDQVIFTNRRVIAVNVQGITGKKSSYFSYPFSKVQYFGVETAGVMDIDSELVIIFSDGNRLQFDFKSKVDVKGICSMISKYVL